MAVQMRQYRDTGPFSEDYYLIREFLLNLGDTNYTYGRWDWMVTHSHLDRPSLGKIAIWEDDGAPVAIAIFDTRPDSIFLLALPGFGHLRADMAAYAAETFGDGGYTLLIPDLDGDYQALAARLGYTATTDKEADALFHIGETSTDYALPDGYRITSMAETYDLYKYGKVLWQGFNHEEKEGPFTMNESKLAEYEASMKRPNVDLDLKIAVVAPDGEFVAYCGMWYDERCELALVEPVATAPKYRRLGLGKAAVLEGIRRCGERGAKLAVVGSSQQFYYSIGFRPYRTATKWKPAAKPLPSARKPIPYPVKMTEYDPMLKPYEKDLETRLRRFYEAKQRLTADGRLSSFANGHLYFGIHRTQDGWVYREWAPNAREIYLIGDFNGWNRTSHPLRRLDDDVWEIILLGHDALTHGSKIRVEITSKQGEVFERIPLYCTRAVQNMESFAFDGQIWSPGEPYRWQNERFTRAYAPPLIYECHIGMSGEKEGVSTYREFMEDTLPRIRALGYNTIQLMAVMEHPYYGSFGYQVSNYFAASSRFGTPEELKALIDAAHGIGIAVLLDLVHSHAVRNEAEGIARFDGTVYQFFHEGRKGIHPQWDSMLFNYGKPQVVHFLLSNLKFWLEEYRFDGFRFDGVTSMLYLDHGIGGSFDHYSKYFSANTDADAITYLQLATSLCKELRPDCLLIAEDMSGMPGMCLPVADGGIGFDYRLGMGVPDLWIKLLKTQKDESWEIGRIWHELTQRRAMESVIGYCESHDQALVGDKTIMFRLADKEMYWHMDNASQSPVIDRAMALHKLIRLITCMNAGEGYLNFMGNEFGHPEWIDFPRPGNGNSYAHARRQWSLADNGFLRYGKLRAFDAALIALANVLLPHPSQQIWLEEAAKFIAFRKNDCLFLMNFHPSCDFFTDIPADPNSIFTLLLDTNHPDFGGCSDRSSDPLSPENGRLRLRVDRRSALVYRGGGGT